MELHFDSSVTPRRTVHVRYIRLLNVIALLICFDLKPGRREKTCFSAIYWPNRKSVTRCLQFIIITANNYSQEEYVYLLDHSNMTMRQNYLLIMTSSVE